MTDVREEFRRSMERQGREVPAKLYEPLPKLKVEPPAYVAVRKDPTIRLRRKVQCSRCRGLMLTYVADGPFVCKECRRAVGREKAA